MGLGKTLQSISLLAHLREARGVHGPHLVLVPKSVMGNWAREFARWAPALRVLKLQGADKEERTRMVREELVPGKWEVVITSFETLCIEHSALRKMHWYYIVVDEAHRIKNEKSVLAQRVRQQASEFRLLLTGTPLQNNLHELWALLNFLLPDLFSSSEDFDLFFASGALPNQEAVKKLHAVLRPFLLRRLKADVEHSLLPKIETKLFIGTSAMQKQWYKAVLSKDVSALNAIGGTDRSRLLNILMQCVAARARAARAAPQLAAPLSALPVSAAPPRPAGCARCATTRTSSTAPSRGRRTLTGRTCGRTAAR